VPGGDQPEDDVADLRGDHLGLVVTPLVVSADWA
jgi:hypothetical protein